MSPVRLLLADDVPAMRSLVRYAIEESGAEIDVVGEAGDGMEAILMAQELRPDVILLDLAMPQMDGLEVLVSLREVAPDTRAVIFSGFASARMLPQAAELGAVAYVEKRQPLDDVLAAILGAGERTRCHHDPAL